MDPEAIKQAQALVDDILSPTVIASFLSCCSYGIVLSLAFIYWTRFPSDRLPFKLLVGFLTLTATADTAVQSHWAYRYAVLSFAQPAKLAAAPWDFTAYTFLTGVNVAVCQAFFAWRVWIVSNRKSHVLTGLTVTAAVAGAGLAFYLGVYITTVEWLPEVNNRKVIMWTWLAVQLAIDIVITTSMTYFIFYRPRRVGSAEAVESSPLNRLVVQSLQTNAISLLVQAAVLVLILTSSTFNYAIPAFLESKTYIGSLLFTLNARSSSSSSSSGGDHNSSSYSTDKRLKGFGAGQRSSFGHTAAQSQLRSIHVHVEEAVEVDDAREPATPAKAWPKTPRTPGGGREQYAVRFGDEERGGDGYEDEEKGSVRMDSW
ncbi:hypothetical protein JCM8097_006284 [Rhodosporidiobolus ruineniae]